jgi:NADPH2:quinone reductase
VPTTIPDPGADVRAVQITEFGGPEVLTLTDVPDPVPGEGLQLLEVSSAGVNYADTHQVEDSYLSRTELPLVPGSEVVGRLPDGSRVAAFAMGGGYAEKALVHPAMSFPLPDGRQRRAGALADGPGPHRLAPAAHVHAPAAGESVVVHAAAGGVGTLASSWPRPGAPATSSGSPRPRRSGRWRPSSEQTSTVDAGAPDLKAALEQANGGRKVDIVLEMVGGPTFDASLAALAPVRPAGHLRHGVAHRAEAVHSGELMSRSRAVIGFWLAHCFARPDMLQPQMAELLAMVEAGTLKPVVGGTYPLAEVRRAHEDLRSRASQGKLVLDCTA